MRKKVYGSSRVDGCPFCGKQATSSNEQGIPVCTNHVKEEFPAIRCVCREYLDLRIGKYGPYFNCFNCGDISWAKAMEIKSLDIRPKKKKKGEVIDGEFIVSFEDL